MGTQVVAVRSLLIDGIKDLPELVGVDATFGFRAGSKKRERVWTQRATFSHEPASLRAAKTFRNESGRFEVVVLVEGIGKDALWTCSRAAAIGLQVEEWVAVHANWEGRVAGLNWIAVEGDGAMTDGFNDKGSVAELVYTITYQARLT